MKLVDPDKIGEILITGCSTGIGRALAQEFHARGYRVLATARRVETMRDLASAGIAVAALDVTDPVSIAALELDKRGVGMLVNNAGLGVMGAMLDVPLEQMRRQFETNVVGVLALVQAVTPSMIRRKRGRIVNVSSVSGVLATPFSGAYCASKAAVNVMSDAMRLELAPFGVRVITVQPGAIRSAFGETATSTIDAAATAAGLYAPLAAAIAARAVAGQRGAMPAEDFARAMAELVLRPKPPSLVRIGPHSAMLPALRRWLPESARDALLSRRFELTRLAK